MHTVTAPPSDRNRQGDRDPGVPGIDLARQLPFITVPERNSISSFPGVMWPPFSRPGITALRMPSEYCTMFHDASLRTHGATADYVGYEQSYGGSMKVRTLGIGLTVLLAAGCGRSGPSMAPDTQTFTRNVNATPSRVVEATTAVFAERMIPVSSTDETNGRVSSVPLDLKGDWGNMSPDERVDCGAVTANDANARMVLTMHVKQERNQSVVSLEAKRDGGQSCVLRGPFMTRLLDDIIARVGVS